MQIIKKDVLILGSGLAGLYTAIHIDASLDVLVVTKTDLEKTNSVYAQGGIAACWNKDDSFSSHISDTLKAGNYVNKEQSVELLVENAPKEIKQLITLGVDFDKNDTGKLRTTLEGGHSKHRVLHADGDATGRVVMETVLDTASKKENIEFMENSMAIQLIKEHNEVKGAYLLQHETVYCVIAKSVVLATGGLSGIYHATTNELSSTGDGLALAFNIGAKLKDMCYVQFHPTALYEPTSGKRFLISEAVRGEGAILLNSEKERFMKKYHPQIELAPRDIVSQCITHEMKKTNSDFVYLDSTHKSKDFLKKRFPTIYKTLESKGIYMEKDYIKVAPVAHYSIGGVVTDLQGRTTIRHLYACGEVASTQVHGANRLASNSLLECLVFGHQIASHINEHIKTVKMPSFNIKDHQLKKKASTYSDAEIDIKIKKMTEDIRNIMMQDAGIIRDNINLNKGYKQIMHILKELESFTAQNHSYYTIKHMAQTALLLLEDALNKKNSIGCHYRIN